jgi:predicted signal transduction protein with EAL and GGDEF domain
LVSGDECQLALDRLLQMISAPYAIGGSVQAGVSASIGVTMFPHDAVDPDTLVRHADHAMYVAKQSGKNRYQMFDTLIEQRIETRHATQRRLAEALELGQLSLFYQPQVDCRQGRVLGAEALIRWQHPTLGLLPPREFLPLIEDTDLALAIGEWVIREALSQRVRWLRQGIDLQISVNAFACQLLQPGFVAGLCAILDQIPEAGRGGLQIEIVETAALKDLDLIRQVIEDCRKLGVSFSLDDFGTGYSTLAHLRHLPVGEIKIDQSFVHHMLERAEDLAIVEAVIGLGHAFGRTLVAEGVETPAQIDRLRQLGCDVLQGYALARPMPAGDFPRWLSAFRLAPGGNPDPD